VSALVGPAGTLAAIAGGVMLWFLAEYLLHRFAMHHLHGRGIMSREHLEHHVHSSWRFGGTHLLSWAGVLLVGAGLWGPIGWWLGGPPVAVGLSVGWAAGYAFYEWQHARAHLVPPRTRYGRWLRRHHFHHHFGHPMANHGVSIPLWDHVFGTHQHPDRVRVPRRLAMPWLLDGSGGLRPEFADHYELVGAARSDQRQAAIDRAKAFASIAPDD
jgi:sterol desaturase/sphingolipid hydroxylase (fatty acid hydroxylase superfamily)